MIDCHQVEKQLYEFLDKELDQRSAEEFQKHLELCRVCFNHVQFEQMMRDHLKKTTHHVCPSKVRKRIQNLLDQY